MAAADLRALRDVADAAAGLHAFGWWKLLADPSLATWENYSNLWNDSDIPDALCDDALITIGGTILLIMIAALAGYAFAWLEFPGRDWLFVVVIALLVVPLQMALIPVFKLYNTLGLFDTILGLVLYHTAFALPFAIFLLRNFFIGIPKDVFESARIDGASELRIFFRLVLPLGLPAIASLAIFQFLWVWNDLIVALTFGRETQPITVAIFTQRAPVRQQHRADRARVVHLAGDPARGVPRVPALLHPGTAGGIGQVEAVF